MSAISGWLKMSDELKKKVYHVSQHGSVLELDESDDAHREALGYFQNVKGSDTVADSPFAWRIRKSAKAGEWTWLFAIRDDLLTHLRSGSFERVSATL